MRMSTVKPLHLAKSLTELNKLVDTKTLDGATPKGYKIDPPHGPYVHTPTLPGCVARLISFCYVLPLRS